MPEDARRARGTRDRGVGLVEVIVVMAVVGILAAIVVPAWQGLVRSVQESSTRSDLRSSRTAIAAWQLDNNGLLPTEAGFRPGATGVDLVAYGWARGSDTKAFAYSTNTPTKATAYCLQMTSTDDAVYRVSTNKDLAAGTCAALGRAAY